MARDAATGETFRLCGGPAGVVVTAFALAGETQWDRVLAWRLDGRAAWYAAVGFLSAPPLRSLAWIVPPHRELTLARYGETLPADTYGLIRWELVKR